ncbi:MAG: chemotaxis protein CheX [Cellulosilyticaceae bacterium]
MFTQFFGSYLLNEQLVTPQQLAEALELQKTVRLKLGVLAINAGYMTAGQVEEVHAMQGRVDKRIGDIAVEMGFMTCEQVETLLNSQKTGYLLLGQALVDKGYMNNTQFEAALIAYKAENHIEECDESVMKQGQVQEIIQKFYQFDVASDAEIYTEYITLLFRNLIRFIGSDFTPMPATVIQSYDAKWLATQEIIGDFGATIGLEGDEEAFIGFASRFAEETFETNDEYVKASVGEFLNVQDGIFSVNMSDEKEKELDLKPQSVDYGCKLQSLQDAYLIPICFPFGTVNFIIGQYEL